MSYYTRYSQHHGASFGFPGLDSGSYHSYMYFNLLPTSKPVIEPPQIKKESLEIPGADGEIDYTESLTGRVTYKNRTGTFPYKFIGDRTQWDKVYHDLLNKLHGQKKHVVLDDDRAHYYYGRLSVNAPQYDSAKKAAYFTITGDFEPYQSDLIASDEPWIWDNFSFEDGVIQYLNYIFVDSMAVRPQIISITGSPKPVIPSFSNLGNNPITIKYTSVNNVVKTVTLAAESYNKVFDDFILYEGVTEIEVSGGDSYLNIHFRGRRL